MVRLENILAERKIYGPKRKKKKEEIVPSKSCQFIFFF